MATKSQQKRKELREKRMQAEQEAQSADKRQNLIKILGIAAFLVVVGIVVAVVALSGGSGGGGGGGDNGQAQLAGKPQNGITLGQPDAPVTLVEFGDLQCPICRQYAEDILPDVIKGPVADGTAKIEFENWAIIGPDSTVAAKAALAAAEQNKMWNFLEAFYANQGVENSGYVTDDFINEIAGDAGIPDMDKFEKDRSDPAFAKELVKIDATASNNGFTGTPTFAFREPDGSLTQLDNTQSPDAIISAINDRAKNTKSSDDTQ